MDYSNPNYQQQPQQPEKQGSNDALLAGAIAAIAGAALGAGGVAVAGTLSDTPEVEVEEETPETEETQDETDVNPEPEVIHVVHHVQRPVVRAPQPQGGRAIAQVGDLRITSVEVMQQHTMPDGRIVTGAHIHVNGRPGVIVDTNNDGIADGLNYDINGNGLIDDNTIDLRPYNQTISMSTLSQHAENHITTGTDGLVDGGIAAAIGATTAGNPVAQNTGTTNGNGDTATIETVNNTGGVTTGPVGEDGEIALNNNIDPDLPDYTNNANVAAIDTASTGQNDLAMNDAGRTADVQVEAETTPQPDVQVETQPDVAQVEVDYSQPDAQVEVAQTETPQADVQVAETPMADVAQADVQVETSPATAPEPPADIDPMATAEMGMGGMDNGMDGLDGGMDAMPDDGGMA